MEAEGMKKHKTAVAAIAEKVKAFAAARTSFRIYHGETNSTRISNRTAGAILDTSGLSQILKIDGNRRLALVEPNVPMDALVAATLPHGLVPQVVPEFPGITVGGSFSGTAAESSSFKFGYFDQSVNWAEFVLADGRIIEASAKNNADLFFGAVGACGTLAIGTLFELNLIEVRRFVEVRYIPVHSISDALAKFEQYSDNTVLVDFVEAIIFGPTSGAMILGTLKDEVSDDAPIVRFTRPQDPWFYLHAHESVPHARDADCGTCAYSKPRDPFSKGGVINIVPIEDYLFRYDRGAFWMGTYGQKPWFFNRFSRYITDPLMRTRAMYKALHHSGRSQTFIIQDLVIPQQSTETFLSWADDTLHIYPLWLCPIKAATKAPLHLANGLSPTGIVINVGLWGLKTSAWPSFQTPVGSTAFKRFIGDNRAIEAKVRELGGLKWLYAHNYYTEEEFWSIYDKEQYDGLRKKWGAEGLPSLWDKMNNTGAEYVEKEPFWKAIVLTILEREHLLV